MNRMPKHSGWNSPSGFGSSNLNCIPTRRGFWNSVGSRPEDREQRGEGKPETFAFLGFTHICGKTRSNGYYTVLRQTIRKRMQAKLSEVKDELRRRMHDPIPEVGQWLRTVVGGHIRYYGVPMNNSALGAFRLRAGLLWHQALSRRSPERHVRWDRMRRLIDRSLPPASVYDPYPLRRMRVIT